ncbi:hypothetical protein BBJ28_00000990, partial [Nothophytophthora sp. Chile5]
MNKSLWVFGFYIRGGRSERLTLEAARPPLAAPPSSMGNSSSSNAGATANVRPHGKRNNPSHRRAQQQKEQQQQQTPAAAAPMPPPAPAAAARRNPQTRERKAFKELVRLPAITGELRDINEFYDIEKKELGHGHYGTVRVGVSKATGVKMAIKTIPKAKVSR